ncbi:hypothetical protein HJC23_013676 [Cyclotella cryptica]|uniref:Uncharacterized protein n=1 Tax=Cyclotella cryptica TaxID=29204 RepID=A0ABD3QVD0_9STRA
MRFFSRMFALRKQGSQFLQCIFASFSNHATHTIFWFIEQFKPNMSNDSIRQGCFPTPPLCTKTKAALLRFILVLLLVLSRALLKRHCISLPTRFSRMGDSSISALPNLILGCMAEWAHLPVTLPIDCVTTAIQTDDKNRGAFVLMGNILSEKGIGGFYKGIQAYTILCLKPAIQYTVYEQVKKIVIAARRVKAQGRAVDDSLSAAEAFFLGMFARIVATMLTYPYLRAKVMLQSTYGNAKVKPTIPQMISEQLSKGGVWGLYQGIGPELTRGVFSAALMMMVKERIGVVVRALIDGPTEASPQKRVAGH